MKIFMKVKCYGWDNPFELSETRHQHRRRIVDVMNKSVFSYGTNERRIRKIYNNVDHNEALD